ncbi:sensor histidine kinase [Streptomyces heilongjiangensis]|uniref:histidine kinase n=1 Tax=Streptomyces heilongjiangensis TaxID=945052 RepID=A0ABW1BAF8_9ACTN|nr:HAMP domain-containing sensor histidine kinase [Streptomyces heilongjiangensis]MDC2946327.1 HAMP domain-containing sensor histidine kinase [Streptomyces heilongjiangensis]
MELADGILLDVLQNWPDRWSHPALVSELAAGRPLPVTLGADALDELAEEVLDGLLVPRSAATAARHLLAEGRFDLVDLMLDGGRLPLEDARQLKDDLADARLGAAGRATRALHLLARRAEQLELAHSWHEQDGTVRELVELATTDESAFTELLAGWEEQATDAEDARRGALRAELDRSRKDGEPPDRATRNLLEECLTAGEFRLARVLVHSDRAQFPDAAGPSGLARRPSPVRLRRYELADVLEWYRYGELASAELHGWLPPEEDTAGRRLVDAFAELVLAGTDVPPDPAPVRELVEALHECVGTAEPLVECEPLASGVVSRLYCTGDHRLPPLGFFRTGIPLWVAPSTTEPPESVTSAPFVWLVPEWAGETPPAEGCGSLYADDLLRLAAPEPGGSVVPAAERQLALLRAVGPGLGVSGLLDAGRAGGGRGLELAGRGKAALQLSWFFDLLGLQPDSVTAEAVLYETGGHPLALRELLRTLCDGHEPRASGRDLRARLEAVREDTDWRRRAARRIQDRLPDVSVGLALHTALWLRSGGGRGEFDVGEFDVEELTDVLADLAGSDGVPPLVDLADGVEPLVSHGIMERREGSLTLVANGLPELLARGSGRQSEEMVAGLIRQAREQADAVLAQVVVSLSQITVDTVDHYNTNLQRRLSEIATRMAEEEDRERRMTLNEEYLLLFDQLRQVGSLTRTAQEPPRPVPLGELIVQQSREAHLGSGGRDRYDIIGADHLWVTANPWLLGQIFWNLFDNARKAIDATAAKHGFVDVTVIPFTDAEDRPWCAINVADSGDGIAQGVASRLNQGECLTTRNGSGQGVRIARTLTELYKGRLRVLPEPSPELSGAQIRIELPLTTVSTED